MHRKACRAMSPRLPRVLLAAALAVTVPATAVAEPLWWALRQTGGAPAPAPQVPPSATLADVVGAPTTVTLADLLQLAVRQAPSLETARVDVEIALAQIEAARGLDDWQVGADANIGVGTRNTSFGVVVATSGSLSGDVSRLLSSGGTVSLHAERTYFRPEGGDDTWSDSITIGLDQPLMRGRGRAITRASETRAKVGQTVAELSRTQAALSTVREVVVAYWDLVLALRSVEIAQSSLGLAQERLRITQAAIRGGGVAATEALAVEQIIAAREEAVLDAELTVLERSLALRRLVGMEIGPDQLGLVTATDLGLPAVEWDLGAMLADAYRTSPELALLASQGELAEIEVEVTENGLLPQLDLTLSAGPSGTDNSPGDPLVNMVTLDGYAVSAGLTYRQSLGKHAAAGASRAARAERRKIKIDEADLRIQLAQSLTETIVVARAAERRVELARRTIELAAKNIVAEQSRFQLGKATNFDVLERQDELKQAELNQARAIIDWHKARTQAAAITGTLLVDYGVTLRD
jgi:outer membrane protein TolC